VKRREDHSRVDETLDDRHASLGELLLGITAGSVRDVDGVVDVDVVGEGDVLHLDTVASQRGRSTFDRCGAVGATSNMFDPPSTIATTSDSARSSRPSIPV
jgi:hypothetical protein